MDQEAHRTVRRDLARPVALALNVVFAVLLTALTMLLLVVGAVGLVGQNESVAQSDLAGIAYAAAVLAGVIGLALLPAVFLLVTGIGRYIRRESGRRLRAADFGLVAAYLLVAVLFDPLRVSALVHGLGVAAIAALVALEVDLRFAAASPFPPEPDANIRTAGGGWRARRRRR